MAKKVLLLLVFSVGLMSAQPRSAPSLPPQQSPALIYERVLGTEYKRVQGCWNFRFQETDSVFDASGEWIEDNSLGSLYRRYSQMLHAPFLNNQQTDESLDRVFAFTRHVPELVSFLDSYLGERGRADSRIVSMSLYGSFLYKIAVPDDIDILVIVDSPVRLFHHVDVSFEEATGSENIEGFPVLSFQIVDQLTYETARAKLWDQEDYVALERAERIASQQMAMADKWYLTIYGREFCKLPTAAFDFRVRENFLLKAFDTLRAAGSRLFGQAYTHLDMESDKVRLRKVLSRIMVTDFIVAELYGSIWSSDVLDYRRFYNELRDLAPDDQAGYDRLQKTLEEFYYQRLLILLFYAESFGRIDHLKMSGPV